MLALCKRFHPTIAVMVDAFSALTLTNALKNAQISTTVLSGADGLEIAATHADIDIVVAGIVGMAGFVVTLQAAQAGKTILLANKEALVVSGHLFIEAARLHHATILPIDSEHNGIFQCLGPDYRIGTTPKVASIGLTASGGPFLRYTADQLKTVTPAAACKHPRWNMGAKISIDSATMMNKGLEVIEAHWLFQLPLEKIQVIVHPQSTIHGWVTYPDGTTLTHMGVPDMRVPIAHALAWPARLATNVPSLDWSTFKSLQFELPNLQQFPCLQLARDALQRDVGAPVVLNAANEVVVAAFLAQKVAFLDIAQVVERVLTRLTGPADSIAAILALDYEARALARQTIEDLC